MTSVVLDRRSLLAAGGSILVVGLFQLLLSARRKVWYQPLRCTPSRRRDPARRAAHPNLGAHHGGAGARTEKSWATLTDKNGVFRLEMPQIIPIFG